MEFGAVGLVVAVFGHFVLLFDHGTLSFGLEEDFCGTEGVLFG